MATTAPSAVGKWNSFLPAGRAADLRVLHRRVRGPEVDGPLGDGGDAGAGAVRLVVDLDVAVQVAVGLEPAHVERGRERGAGSLEGDRTSRWQGSGSGAGRGGSGRATGRRAAPGAGRRSRCGGARRGRRAAARAGCEREAREHRRARTIRRDVATVDSTSSSYWPRLGRPVMGWGPMALRAQRRHRL